MHSCCCCLWHSPWISSQSFACWYIFGTFGTVPSFIDCWSLAVMARTVHFVHCLPETSPLVMASRTPYTSISNHVCGGLTVPYFVCPAGPKQTQTEPANPRDKNTRRNSRKRCGGVIASLTHGWCARPPLRVELTCKMLCARCVPPQRRACAPSWQGTAHRIIFGFASIRAKWSVATRACVGQPHHQEWSVVSRQQHDFLF
jgi:hypothetical protein